MPIEPGIILRKEEILKRITQEEIFEKYLQLPVDISVTYNNPLRLDKTPSCRYYYKNDKLRFHDWGKFNWDCFSLVQHIYNCTFIDALRIIVKDFKLNTQIERYEVREYVPTIKPRYNLKIKIREWELDDLEYWNQYGITVKDLAYFNVYPCKAIWINGEYYKCRKNDVCFAYYFGNDLFKLYFPKRQKSEGRFFTNIIESDFILQGELQLPDKCDLIVITKSYKDVIGLRRFGVYAVATQSEYQILTKAQYERLSLISDRIVSLGDHDNTGRNFMIRHYKAYNIPYLVFPWTMEKDFTDNRKRFGEERMQQIINYVRKAA